MRKARNESGMKRFSPDQWLTSQQIQSFWSRLTGRKALEETGQEKDVAVRLPISTEANELGNEDIADHLDEIDQAGVELETAQRDIHQALESRYPTFLLFHFLFFHFLK